VTVNDAFALTVSEPLYGDVFVAFPPAGVALHAEPPRDGAVTSWAVTVSGVERHGDNVRVRLTGPVTALADVTPATAAELRLHGGLPLWASVAPAQTRVYPAS
jgi:molybdate transport system ATP-binding protein